MSGISEKNLRLMATVNDAEYRVIDRPQGGKRMDADFGTFLGRMERNLKITSAKTGSKNRKPTSPPRNPSARHCTRYTAKRSAKRHSGQASATMRMADGAHRRTIR